MDIKRFDVCYVDLPPPMEDSSVQGGVRPAVIVSNNKCNAHSPVVSIIPITSRVKKPLPTHVKVYGCGLNGHSTALCEQITSIDKRQIVTQIGSITHEDIQKMINRALRIQLEMQ